MENLIGCVSEVCAPGTPVTRGEEDLYTETVILGDYYDPCDSTV